MQGIQSRLIVTLGDPWGVGVEVAVKAIRQGKFDKPSRIILVGCNDLVKKAYDLAGGSCEVEILDVAPLPPREDLAGRGRFAYLAVERGVRMCLEGKGDALVTAPLNKRNLAEAGYSYPGHTELIGELCGAKPVMMLIGGRLRVAPLTTHCALIDVPSLLSIQGVAETLATLDMSLRRDFGIGKPRIALTGLNPHAGEGGRFGREEIDILSPAAELARLSGVDVTDPIPADTAFWWAAQGKYDAVASPTHDQALIPVKLHAFDRCVNVTLGLPIVRTSPGHGTAEDIAWQGKADPGAMIEAMDAALRISENRKDFRRE